MLYDFAIEPQGEISRWFLNKELTTFQQAATWVQALPYLRNDKPEAASVMRQLWGVCSTKHALLKILCNEQQHNEYKLIVGLYKMNEENTKGVGKVLDHYQLPYVVEAHTYLKNGGTILDFTKSNNNLKFCELLIDEIEIEAHQVGAFKIELHKKYLSEWLSNSQYRESYTLDEIWKIREECIETLFT